MGHKRTKIEDVKQRLPSFVKIIEDTYHGIAGRAKFIDTEYNNEIFYSTPNAVIRQRSGCRTRTAQKASDKMKGKINKKIPLSEIKKKLHPFLEIIDESYVRAGENAIFYDKEYNLYFIAQPRNVLKGKGYCQKRKHETIGRKNRLSLTEVKRRIKEKYGDSIKIKEDTYKHVNTRAAFIFEDGRERTLPVGHVIYEKCGINRRKTREWRKKIIDRDRFCQVCGIADKILAHHLYSWVSYPEQRFNPNNGICLCNFHHKDFHAKFGGGENTPHQFIEYLRQKLYSIGNLGEIIKQRLNIP